MQTRTPGVQYKALSLLSLSSLSLFSLLSLSLSLSLLSVIILTKLWTLCEREAAHGNLHNYFGVSVMLRLGKHR
jgi:hypothetical protein